MDLGDDIKREVLYVCDAVFVSEPFEETEEKWLSSLENTRWLEYVRFVQLQLHSFFSLSSFWFGPHPVCSGILYCQS